MKNIKSLMLLIFSIFTLNSCEISFSFPLSEETTSIIENLDSNNQNKERIDELKELCPEYFNLSGMKGIEIYAWQENNQYKFGFMIATNRIKSIDEINALEGLSIDDARLVVSTYSQENKNLMRNLFIIDKTNAENYFVDKISHQEEIDILLESLGVAKFSETSWNNNSGDKRDLFDAFLNEITYIKTNESTKDNIESVLGTPDNIIRIDLDTYPVQYGGCIYQYNLYEDENDKYVAEFVFNQNNKLAEIRKETLKKEQQIIPTGMFKLTVIDKNNVIYDKLVENESYYTPFSIIKFHSHVIMDASLGMYVDGQFVSIQNPIFVDDEYIWEYEFEMPIQEATIEFKLMPELHSLNELNWIKQLEENQISKVIVEQGYIGVDPETNKPTIQESNSIDDISYNLSILKNATVCEFDYDITGGYYYKVTFVINEQTSYVYEISNGYLYIANDDGNYQYYRFTDYSYSEFSNNQLNYPRIND